METFLTIHQTEAHLKAYDVPVNCSIPIIGKPALPAFCNNDILSIHMVMLEESLLGYSKILELMDTFKVKRIVLNSCYSDNINDRKKRCLVKRVNSNIFALLPESMETYMMQLGNHTRRDINCYERRFFRAYDSVDIVTQHNSEVDLDDYMDVIRLSRERCLSKGFISAVDDSEAFRLYEVIKLYGVLTIMKNENKVIGGTIGTILGNQMTLHIIGHDNFFNDFHIGYIIMKKTVEQAIKDKIHVINFTWGGTGSLNGRTNWKVQFGNERKFLNDITYYKYFTDYWTSKFEDKYRTLGQRLSEEMINVLRKIYHLAKGKFKMVINQ